AAWWNEGEVILLSTPEGFTYSDATDINNNRQIVGLSLRTLAENGVIQVADLWDTQEQQAYTLNVPEGYGWSTANAINDAGQAVGATALLDEYHMVAPETRQAVMWDLARDEVTVLGTLPGAGGAEATGINASGAIVGWCKTAEGLTHAVRWDGDRITDLG